MAIAIRYSLHNAQPEHYDALTQLFVGLGWHPAMQNAHYQYPPANAVTALAMLEHGQVALKAFTNYMAGIADQGVTVAQLSLVFDENLPYNPIW